MTVLEDDAHGLLKVTSGEVLRLPTMHCVPAGGVQQVAADSTRPTQEEVGLDTSQWNHTARYPRTTKGADDKKHVLEGPVALLNSVLTVSPGGGVPSVRSSRSKLLHTATHAKAHRISWSNR